MIETGADRFEPNVSRLSSVSVVTVSVKNRWLLCRWRLRKRQHSTPKGTSMQYSETTWAVGIAQSTHHEVQGGGKNPETGGRGIFAPTANRVVS